VTTPTTLICLSICCAPCAVLAQAWAGAGAGADVGPAYASDPYATNAADKTLLLQADRSRHALESSLSGYLVAFDTTVLQHRPRVGVPLAAFPAAGLELAYDVSGQSVMAQWRLSQPSSPGNRIEYRAFVGATGTASLVISTRF
jgi:hypothetical protein